LANAVLAWLDAVQARAWTEYVREKRASQRRLQTGQARGCFEKQFPDTRDRERRRICDMVLRLAACDGDPRLGWLRGALRRLAVEQDWQQAGGRAASATATLPTADPDLRAWLDRLCDWLDSVHHGIAHALSHETPERFDPDPGRQELATLGVGLRMFPDLKPQEQRLLSAYQAGMSPRFRGSAQWSCAGQVMAKSQRRTWSHPEVDAVTIACWPLVKAHDLTYEVLMGAIRELLPHYAQPRVRERPPLEFNPPLDSAGNFASHCVNVLGLRKSKGHDRRAVAAEPARIRELIRRLFARR
jgi:hypothetical protein